MLLGERWLRDDRRRAEAAPSPLLVIFERAVRVDAPAEVNRLLWRVAPGDVAYGLVRWHVGRGSPISNNVSITGLCADTDI